MSAPKGAIVDHINGDRLDNRKANLRLLSRGANSINSAKVNSACGFRGVTWDKKAGRWTAYIRHNDKRLFLGYFDTPDEANLARLRKEKELFGIQPRRLQAFIDAGLAEAA